MVQSPIWISFEKYIASNNHVIFYPKNAEENSFLFTQDSLLCSLDDEASR